MVMALHTLLTATMAAAPVCAQVSPEAQARLPLQWSGELSRRIHRPVSQSPDCRGDRLLLAIENEQLTVRFADAERERALPPSAAASADGLAMLLAGLIADPSLPAATPDLSSPPPVVVREPVAVPTPPEPQPERVWLYAGGGIALASGLGAPALHLGAAGRYRFAAFGAEFVQLGGLVPSSNQFFNSSRRWELSLMFWVGHNVGRWRFDGGVGLGFISVTAPWEPSPTGNSYFKDLGFSARPVARARYEVLSFLAITLRTEFAITTALSSAPAPGAYAALSLGLEARLGGDT